MKAKHFKKLRAKMRYYLVLRSYGMFGDFLDYMNESTPIDQYTEVLATSPQQAAKRYMERTNAVRDLSRWDQWPDACSERVAKLRVVPKDMPFNRFATYWK